MLTVTRQHVPIFQQTDPSSLEQLPSGQFDHNNNGGPFVLKGIEVRKYNERDRVAFTILRNRFLNDLETEFNEHFLEKDR